MTNSRTGRGGWRWGGGLVLCLVGWGGAPVEAARENFTVRLAETEVELRASAREEVRHQLDVIEADLQAWRDLTPTDLIVAARLRDWIAELRFLNALFDAAGEGEAWRDSFRSNPRARLERFLADGTTVTAPLSYAQLILRGEESVAALGWTRLYELVADDPVAQYRLLVRRASLYLGLAHPGADAAVTAVDDWLARHGAAKVEDWPEYGIHRLWAVQRPAWREDYAAALSAWEAWIAEELMAPVRARVARWGGPLQALREGEPAERVRYAAEPADLPRVRLETEAGELVLTLFEDDAPETVANFISLVEVGFYDGLQFHRVVPGFVAQAGDPRGTGEGGPGYGIRREAGRAHLRGAIGMARATEPDSAGSQFYLCLTTLGTHGLNDQYAVFGRVSEGMAVLDRLRLGTRIVRAEVLTKRDHAYAFARLP